MGIFKLKVLLFSLSFTCVMSAQVEGYLKKAENSVDRGNLKEAKEYYLKALVKEPENKAANMGLGLIYSELLDNYSLALPYLQKASAQASRDTSYDLIFALAKCYHFNNEFDKALSYYNQLKGVQDLEKETDFQKDINKRKADCEYAKSKVDSPKDKNIYLVNAGKAVNTDMPEYVPVLSSHKELLFTSKRKDDSKEQLNYLDGKYFESMYIANIENNGFSNVRRYTLPDKLMNSQFYKHHQAVVSISQDGKKLFTFRDSKLYEINLEDRTVKEPGEVKIKKFDHYQNHAFLTKDGRTLYFTSDVPGGLGGNDIYKSSLTSGGEWGKAENLGAPINSSFDEDAPYIANDGTLYFASKGHQGFGNYDIYKSTSSGGKWSAPENLGEPINSTGHDIFLVLDTNSSLGYFSSSRNGGFGDMDIYKIMYLDKFKPECTSGSYPALALNVTDSSKTDYKNKVEVTVPSNYKLLSAEWKVNDNLVNSDGQALNYDYGKAGVNKVFSKAMFYCDTCLTPLVACQTIENKVVETNIQPIASNDNGHKATETNTTAANTEDEKEKGTTGTNTASGSSSLSIASDAGKATSDITKFKGQELNSDQLAEIGFNSNHILFDFNKSTLRKDAYDILDTNIRVLKKYPALRLQVNGYADSRGSKAVNERISASRARTVKDYLMSKGVPASRILFVSGKGAEKLLNSCGVGVECDETQHQQNRRVEFVVIVK